MSYITLLVKPKSITLLLHSCYISLHQNNKSVPSAQQSKSSLHKPYSKLMSFEYPPVVDNDEKGAFIGAFPDCPADIKMTEKYPRREIS